MVKGVKMKFPNSELDISNAHKYAFQNKPYLLHDSRCGCYYCLKIFSPIEITRYADDNSIGTAICPYCGVDAVIGESSGFPIAIEFLEKMHNKWF